MTTERRKFIGQVTEKKASVAALFRGWADYSEGDYVVGRYHSMYETEFRKQKQPNWRIEVLDASFKVQMPDGKMVSPVGKILVLNSAGQLNKALTKAKIGQIVDLTYGGKRAGKDDPDTKYHTFTDITVGWAPGEGDTDAAPEASKENFAEENNDW